LYFTDVNPEVVAEIERVGYTARCADVRNVEDLKQLTGARTAIATGLFHFLDDDAARQVFANLAEAGFRGFVFNNMNTSVSEELKANWTKLGYRFYPREPEHIPPLLSDGWQIEQSLSMRDFFQHNAEVGTHLVQLENLHNIFLVVRE
jgi:hypothetical protein